MPDPNQWQEDFSYLAPEVIEYLAGQGVILIGIDTPSVDHSTSKELGAHQAVFRFGMAILEGLDLSEVSGGLYQLIALPLKIKGAEASPVRAVLTNE
jgi:arylformamidase